MTRFEGPISGRDAALLASLSLFNARDLLEEAGLLFERGRYSRATAIAVIAIEEIAKWHLVQDRFIETPDDRWKEFWSEVRSHPTKLKKYKHSRYMEALKTLYGSGSGMWTETVAEIESEPDLKALREGCLYVDYDGKAVLSPRQQHNERADSERILHQADHFLRSIYQPLPPVEEWAAHLDTLRARRREAHISQTTEGRNKRPTRHA